MSAAEIAAVASVAPAQTAQRADVVGPTQSFATALAQGLEGVSIGTGRARRLAAAAPGDARP